MQPISNRYDKASYKRKVTKHQNTLIVFLYLEVVTAKIDKITKNPYCENNEKFKHGYQSVFPDTTSGM
ncbi:MAG: hypothetical protein RR212_01435 [Bacteroidales bacterium]